MVEFTHEQLTERVMDLKSKLHNGARSMLALRRELQTAANTIDAFSQPVQHFLHEHGQVKDGDRLPLGTKLLFALRACVPDVSRETVPKVQVTSEGPMPPETEATAP